MGFFSLFKRSAPTAPEVSFYSLHGKKITCQHCGGDQFFERNALLNTVGMTFFDLDWANRQAALLVCLSCRHIQWYLEKPEKNSVAP